MTENVLLKTTTIEEVRDLHPGRFVLDLSELTWANEVKVHRMRLLDQQMIEINRRLQLIESKLDNYSDKIYSLEKKL